MATLARLTPFRDVFRLQDEMNRLLDFTARTQPHVWQTDGESLANTWVPPVDIYEDEEGITLRAELPGLTSSDIDVRIENNTLTLKGERKLEREERKENYRRVERSYGSFSRSFSLPPTVDTERVKADAKHGVLTVFLPRREETKPKQIQVKVD